MLAMAYSKLKYMPFRQRKKYELEGAEYYVCKGYSITIHKYNGIVCFWKSTDIDKQPQYKGEPLCKEISFIHADSIKELEAILNATWWTYL